MALATHLLNIVIRVTDRSTAPFKRAENNINKVGGAAKRATTDMLGLGLGLTFFMFGVQIQLEKMLRSMFNVFKQAEGETGALSQQFNILKASLAGLSIAFFDALAQSALFDSIISLVTTVAGWFLNLRDLQRETLVEGVIKFLIWSKAIGFVGQLVLGVFIAFQVLKSGALPFLIIGAGLIFLFAKGWKFTELLILAVAVAVLTLNRRMFKFFTITLVSIAPWKILLAGGLIVLALLMHKFGGFGNAMKVWASGIALAIAFVFQFLIDGILFIVKIAAVGLIHLINLMNKIPGVNISTTGLESFVTDFKIDLVGLVAERLDAIGFNPPAVEAEPVTLQSLLGQVNEEVGAIQDEAFKEQQTQTDILSEQISLQEEALTENQIQTGGILDTAKTVGELRNLFASSQVIEDEPAKSTDI